jgi:hypothetical protein
MEIRRSRLDRGGRGYLGIGFLASTPVKAAQWLISGGFETMARLRWASEQRGELGSVNDALDCFQWKGRGSAGAGRAAVSFGPATASSIPYDKIEEEGSGWFVMSSLSGWRRKVGEWLTGGGEFGRASLQMGEDPTMNCVGLR